MAHYSSIRYTAGTSPAIPRAVASIRWARKIQNSSSQHGRPPKVPAILYPDKSYSFKKIK